MLRRTIIGALASRRPTWISSAPLPDLPRLVADVGYALTSTLSAAAAFLILLLAFPAKAEDPNSEFVKQILRLQYTELCATVGKPPQALAEALNQSVGQDPKTWLPVIAWWNAIAEKYKAAGCGDA